MYRGISQKPTQSVIAGQGKARVLMIKFQLQQNRIRKKPMQNDFSCDNQLSECLDRFNAADSSELATESQFCSRWRNSIRPVLVNVQRILSLFPRGRELARVLQVVIDFIDTACPIN